MARYLLYARPIRFHSSERVGLTNIPHLCLFTTFKDRLKHYTSMLLWSETYQLKPLWHTSWFWMRFSIKRQFYSIFLIITASSWPRKRERRRDTITQFIWRSTIKAQTLIYPSIHSSVHPIVSLHFDLKPTEWYSARKDRRQTSYQRETEEIHARAVLQFFRGWRMWRVELTGKPSADVRSSPGCPPQPQINTEWNPSHNPTNGQDRFLL